jgi:hypothetical protein
MPPKEKLVKHLMIPLAAALALAASGAWAKAPADATGECKDGTYTTSATKEGACSSHGGVKKWLAKEDKSAKSSDKPAKADKAAAAAPAAEKPADATGQCKDGSYTNAASKSGACSGHKGVKTWYGGKDNATSTAAPAKSGAAAPTSSAPMSATPAPTKSASAAPAAGGGAGKVWVNTDSKVYHCEKDSMYGKTKQGEYMTEAQAKASGARPSRGKECS